MNGKKLSKSLERLSTLSVQPSAGDANSTSSLRLSSNHQEFVSPPRPRIPPRPNEQALARFKQQQVNLSAAGSPGAARPPGKAARTKYVEVHVSSPKEGTRRGGGEGRTSGVTAPRHSSPVTKSAAARTSYVVLKLNEGSPPSRSQRTSSKQPKKGVQRCRSSVGEQPRRHDNVPRRSAVLSATTTSVNPLVNENLQAPKSEPLSPPLRKPRKLSQPTRPTTSLPPRALLHASPRHFVPTKSEGVCETTLETHQVCHIASPHIIDSRTGTAYTENGENTPRGVDITRQTQAPPSGDFNQEPQTVYPSSGNISHLPRNESTDNSKHSNLQPRRPPPPSRKPPIRPPIPRPRKTRTSAINSLDPPELDPYVQMSQVSSSISCPKSSTDQLIRSPAPPFPSSCGNINRTPLPQASGPWHGGMRETEINVEDNGAYENDYSYVDLVKNQHLMSRTNFTGPHASNTHKDDGKYIYMYHVLGFGLLSEGVCGWV